MVELIKAKIQEALPNATIYVLDPNQDGEHFEALVIAEEFNSLSLVKQHQLVMNSLKEEFKEQVHALALKTFTPANWESKKNAYPLAQ